MIENALKRKWAQGRATINGWLTIGNGFTAEIMANQGYDSVTIDVQHGFLDYNDAKGMIQASWASGAMPLVRVPWLEHGIIMKALDAGAYGVICPMINTAEQAAALAAAVRYPPRGSRSFGPIRAAIAAGDDYAAQANDNILAFAMIETAEALANAAAICATPGIDGIYIGPADLALGLTNGRLGPGFDWEEPELVTAIQTIVETAKNAGLRVGLHCGSPAYAAKAVGWGVDMVSISTDSSLLAAAAATQLADARRLIGQSEESGAGTGSGY